MKNDDSNFCNLYSNHALHDTHRAWVPDYKNPYNLILTFSDDVSEKHARKKYSEFIRKLSKRIYKNAYRRYRKKIDQRAYLEVCKKGRYHIHALLDVREDWDACFTKTISTLWKHGIDIQVKKVPLNEVKRTHLYNSKMRTKKTTTGYYSDAYLVVE